MKEYIDKVSEYKKKNEFDDYETLTFKDVSVKKIVDGIADVGSTDLVD